MDKILTADDLRAIASKVTLPDIMNSFIEFIITMVVAHTEHMEERKKWAAFNGCYSARVSCALSMVNFPFTSEQRYDIQTVYTEMWIRILKENGFEIVEGHCKTSPEHGLITFSWGYSDKKVIGNEILLTLNDLLDA